MMELSIFKNELRPHFVKGVEAVFMFRFVPVATFSPMLTRPPEMDWKASGPP